MDIGGGRMGEEKVEFVIDKDKTLIRSGSCK